MLGFRKCEAMAMLDLTDTEREALCGRFDSVMEGFTALERYDAEGVEPLVSVLELSNILREDFPGKMLTREEMLSNAPEQHDGYFQVPGAL